MNGNYYFVNIDVIYNCILTNTENSIFFYINTFVVNYEIYITQ